ncbi:MAG TPA: hypothetical protein VMT00_06745 [Thermoanaerobaculia bacterium]|nr:hypothetical protein [Thermoanaerobaculia bacterium]
MNGAAENGSMRLEGFQKPALIAGIIGVVVSAAGAVVAPVELFRSYLIAFVFITSLSVGSLAVLMLQYLTGGVWGVLLRRPLEAAARVLPFTAVAFIPVIFGIHSIYEWSHEDVVRTDALLHQKAAYLNTPFFILRSAIYFALWLTATWLLTRWSVRQERADEPSPWRGLKMRHVSAAGLIILALTLTFASVDWLMSITPHWFSTMYGLSFMIATALTAFAFVVIVAVLLARDEPFASIVEPGNFRDFGNLLFAFVMLWAYTTFGEFLLIWYGNLREEVPWYLVRSRGGWGFVSLLLIVFHFFLPFFVLLMRAIKDRPRTVGMVAALVLAMRFVHIVWLVRPNYDATFRLHWLDPVTLVGLFGLWLYFFIGQLRRKPLLPQYEPYVQEATSHA